MLFQLAILGYAIVVGFVTAGIATSFLQLVTSRRLVFAVGGEGLLPIVQAAALYTFTGPMLVFERAVQGRRVERKSTGWLALALAICALWSLCVGLVVLNLVVVLR